MESEKVIYLDYAANTPVEKEVLDAFSLASVKYIGNPNSTHHLGKIARERIDIASRNITENFRNNYNIDEEMELIYTSGASESNNLAIKGVAKAYRENGKHIISTFLEHSSVSAALTNLKEQGYEIDIVDITEDGKVDLEHLKRLLRNETILVSVTAVDGEVGTIQPFNEIAKILKEYENCIFHVDATQAIGKINMNFEDVDIITFAPHKFYGLNGFGGLFKKKEVVLEPLIHGGTSTSIYRSGTPVVSQIVAMEKAVELAFQNQDERFEYVNSLNTALRNELEKYENVKINTTLLGNPYILNLSVMPIKAIDFKEELEKYGVCVSIKSACTTVISPSRIVMAMTRDKKRAFSSFRISLSHLVTEDEIKEFLEAFSKCYNIFFS
ncbi:MAG: cysteine desulfurase [Clostridia bacterium]|nr:cysteine desulfurase [Clostridia bacterium]